jgi:hypothetical protein
MLVFTLGASGARLSLADDQTRTSSQAEEKEDAVKKTDKPRKADRQKRRGGRRDDPEVLREIRVAVLPIGATDDVPVDPDALTDQVVVLMSTLDNVTLVDRADLENVAKEQEMALSGMMDLAKAVQLGKMVSAQYIVVGRGSKLGGNYYLVLKMIDVETTKQTTIAAKGPTESEERELDYLRKRGMEAVIDNLAEVLPENVRKLQTTPLDEETLAKIKELREMLAPFKGKRFVVEVPETHVRSPAPDPAAQMVITHFLSLLDIEFVVPKNPPGNWKERLQQTGVYEKQEVDYLLEGEGVSEFAGRIHGLVSCRARVELRLIKVPGRSVSTIEKGVGAGVDLTESLSAKMALEKAGTQAVEAVLRRAVEKLERDE